MKFKKGETMQVQNDSAVIVDGKLVLTLPDAVSPVVWQMDLDDVKSAALEVQFDKASDTHSLVMKQAGGNTLEVAKFEDKPKAVEALMAASQALRGAQGKIRPQPQVVQQVPYAAPQMHIIGSPANTNNQSSGRGGAMIAIALVVVLIIVWLVSIPGGGEVSPAVGGGDVASAGDAQPAGVAVSADDFLSKQ